MGFYPESCLLILHHVVSSNFSVSNFTSRSLIHLELVLLQGLISFFCLWTFSFQAPFVDDIVFSQVCVLWHHCWMLDVYSYGSSYLGLLYCSIGLHACLCANDILFLSSSVIYHEVEILLALFFFFRIVLAIWSLW